MSTRILTDVSGEFLGRLVADGTYDEVCKTTRREIMHFCMPS